MSAPTPKHTSAHCKARGRVDEPPELYGVKFLTSKDLHDKVHLLESSERLIAYLTCGRSEMQDMSPEARIKALREAAPGNWVAFSHDESQVVAYGKTYDEVVAAAEETGELDPVITRVPTDWVARVFIC